MSLSASQSVGHKVVDVVVDHAQSAAETWTDDAQADRWFPRHTVQTLRDQPLPSATLSPADPLASDADVPTNAAVAALRKLNRQQQEALLLSRGAGLTDRQLGIAMDCSMTAATTHREAALRALREVADNDVGQWLQRIAAAYSRIDLPADYAVRLKKRTVRRRWVATTLQWIGLGLLLCLIAAVMWLLLARVEV